MFYSPAEEGVYSLDLGLHAGFFLGGFVYIGFIKGKLLVDMKL